MENVRQGKRPDRGENTWKRKRKVPNLRGDSVDMKIAGVDVLYTSSGGLYGGGIWGVVARINCAENCVNSNKYAIIYLCVIEPKYRKFNGILRNIYIMLIYRLVIIMLYLSMTNGSILSYRSV